MIDIPTNINADVKAETAPAKREPKRDKYGRAYATGRRKNASARVWIKPGTGKIVVNKREIGVYFARPVLQMIVMMIALVMITTNLVVDLTYSRLDPRTALAAAH